MEIAHFLFGIFGNATALFLFLAPVITFKRIIQHKSTEQFSGLPYVMTLLNCLLSAWYGLPFVSPNNILVTTINGTGAAIEFFYVVIFIIYAPKKEKAKILGLFACVLSVFSVVALVSFFVLHGGPRKLFCGFAAAIFSIIIVIKSLPSLPEEVIPPLHVPSDPSPRPSPEPPIVSSPDPSPPIPSSTDSLSPPLQRISVFSVVALVSFFVLHGGPRKLFCGFAAAIFSIIMYGSPLSIMRTVIKTKSVEFMPFFLSLFVFLCGTSRFVFGLLGQDPFVAVPNGCGCGLGAVQLIIYFIYRNNKGDNKHDNKRGNRRVAHESTCEESLEMGLPKSGHQENRSNANRVQRGHE